MKTRSLTLAAMLVLLLNIAGSAAGDTRSAKAKKRQISRLVSLLPASDGVAAFDSRRFFDESMPRVLSANQPVLAEIMAKINEMENRTGINLRKFDQVVVGVAINQISPTNVDFDPVAIASGDINAGALVAVARLASKGTYREEKIGGRTVYVFTPAALIQKTAVTTTNSKIAGLIDRGLKGLTKEVAVTTLDKNTLVLGSYRRVRQTLEATPRIGTDVTSLLSTRETAVMSFALKPPGAMSQLLPLDTDAFGASIDAIKYISGSLDVAVTGSSIKMMARTKKVDEALQLKDTFEVLQRLGAGIFSSSKRLDQQVYGRMLKNAKFDIHGSDVTFDLAVPQADIDTLISGAK